MAINSNFYDFPKIESYWQTFWDENKIFRAEDFSDKPKFYGLDMFPYPSGEGLHIGHPEGYTASDIVARKRKAEGYNVLHPMGWDAFGLPAEQHAIATGVPPAINTQANINNFKKQLKALGLGFDWERELDTTDPDYYHWTQWIFLQLFKKGLAYVDEKPVWWCPALETVLANEEVIDGRSERGDHPVERRNLRQWVLRITVYADRLLEGLKDLDWPDSTKRQQIAWIGRSEGVDIRFDIQDLTGEQLTTFTTRVDTLYGVTFIVIAPEHPLVQKLTKSDKKAAIKAYIKQASQKSDLKRTDLAKEKTGVFTGNYALNPINGERIPIWVADYVLMSYGTGVIMAVPGHDERDYEFAQTFDLPIKAVVTKKADEMEPNLPYCGKGYAINSDSFDGLPTNDAKVKIREALEAKKHGEASVNYKLRDWLFSRQRYWGEPFPIIWVEEESYQRIEKSPHSPCHAFLPENPVTYQKEGKTLYAVPVPAEELPLELPEVESYQPSGCGDSPLAKATDWLEVYFDINTGKTKLASGEAPEDYNWVRGSRETNTMPQWAGSCWYYLRFCDPKNGKKFLDPKIEKYWQVPDLYIGGAEHAVLHLLYARFWHKVLYDLGFVTTPEPFKRVIHQGIILGEPEYWGFKNDGGQWVSCEFVEEDKEARRGGTLKPTKLTEELVTKQGEHFILKEDPEIRIDARSFKMSKSRGNVVSPDAIIQEYGADALRLYEMFLGPLEAMKPWSTKGIEGSVRFLRRTWKVFMDSEGKVHAKIQDTEKEENPKTARLLQETIKKVSEDIEGLRFNTAISQLMILLNQLQKVGSFSKQVAKTYLQLLAPFAPHITEELWDRLGEAPSIVNAPWPQYDPDALTDVQMKLMLQVNGKLRSELSISKEVPKEEVIALAKADEKLVPFLEGKAIVKEIYVPGRIVNLVVK